MKEKKRAKKKGGNGNGKDAAKIGKAAKKKVADLTYRPEGRITVARGGDARPEVASRSSSAALDFDDRDPLA